MQRQRRMESVQTQFGCILAIRSGSDTSQAIGACPDICDSVEGGWRGETGAEAASSVSVTSPLVLLVLSSTSSRKAPFLYSRLPKSAGPSLIGGQSG